MLLILAGQVVPLPILSDPGAVLVVLVVVWFSVPPGFEVERGAVNPGKLFLIKEVCQPNPSPFSSCERVDFCQFLFGVDRGQVCVLISTVLEGLQEVCRLGDDLDTRRAGAGVVRVTVCISFTATQPPISKKRFTFTSCTTHILARFFALEVITISPTASIIKQLTGPVLEGPPTNRVKHCSDQRSGPRS